MELLLYHGGVIHTMTDKSEKLWRPHMKTYQDFCNTITQQIFDIIDQQGSLLTWQKSWTSHGCQQLPIGAQGLYRGANLLSLLCAQWEIGFPSNQWLTFNQINKQGGCVKKGAKSQTVFFWKIKEIQKEQNGEKITKKVPIFKIYYVFNLEQTTLKPTIHPAPEFQVSTIDALINKLGVTVSHFGNHAHYNGTDDAIVLPNPHCFTVKENYYATLLHELVHWTANKNRVPRQCFNEYHHNIKARAEEELIAEIGSVLLAAHYGLKGELENHASYVQSWKKYLNEKQVMSATHKAAKAFEWLINQNVTH